MSTPSTPSTPPDARTAAAGQPRGSGPDHLIGGRYRLTRLLGSGGMGDVWEAWDERLHRAVAVKRLYAQPGVSADIAEVSTNRAMREARITARLQHPHAVTVYDVVEDHGQPCLVMQLVPSEPLSARLSGGRTLPLQEVALLGSHLASALSAAHQAGIVHRDVKPGNVLLAEDGTARLSDFGIAHAMGDVTLTSTGMVTGTPAYLAPEVARGEESAYPADVFSLGATLYTALEGHPPFGTESNPMALLHRVASGIVEPPQHSGELTPLLEEMLQVRPEDRPSMAEVTAELSAVAAGSSPTTSMPAATTVQDGPLPVPLTDEPDAFFDDLSDDDYDEPDPRGDDRRAPVGAAATTTRRRRGPWLILAVLALLALLAIALFRSLSGDAPVASPPAVSSSAPATSAPSAAPSTTPSATSAAPATSATPAAPSASSPARASTTAPAVPPPATAPPTSTSAPPSTATTTATTPSGSDLAGAVSRYYGVMPGGTDQGWPLLTARYQTEKTGGRTAYQRFWDQFSKVTATDVVGTAPGTVRATITYTFKDGRVQRESTTFGMVVDGGVIKIDTSNVG